MKITKAEWNPSLGSRGRKKSEHRLAIERMGVGDCIRMEHPEFKCGGKNCSLQTNLTHIRRETGFKFVSYHEAKYVMIIRRVE